MHQNMFFGCLYFFFVRKGESQLNYVYHLNDVLEFHMEELNRRLESWPEAWKQVNLLPSIFRSYQFAFVPLHRRMTDLVRQRRSDRTSTPPHVFTVLDPCVYFVVTRQLGTPVVVNNVASCEVMDPADMDLIFPPTAEELQSDDQVHPFYGHSMKSRWYDQRFDLDLHDTANDGSEVSFTSRQYVLIDKGISLRYHVVKHQLSVECVWKGVHKEPSQTDLDEWQEGFVYNINGDRIY